MNRIFKAVWNESSGTWVAASETSKSRTKRSLAPRKLVIAQAAMIGGLMAGSAHAQVVDQWVAAGDTSGADSVAAGATAFTIGNAATAVGSLAMAADHAVAVGYNATANGDNAIAVGSDSFAAKDAMAVGTNAQANKEQSTSIETIQGHPRSIPPPSETCPQRRARLQWHLVTGQRRPAQVQRPWDRSLVRRVTARPALARCPMHKESSASLSATMQWWERTIPSPSGRAPRQLA